MYISICVKMATKVVATSTCNVVELEAWDSPVGDPTSLFCSQIECIDHFLSVLWPERLWSMKLPRSRISFVLLSYGAHGLLATNSVFWKNAGAVPKYAWCAWSRTWHQWKIACGLLEEPEFGSSS